MIRNLVSLLISLGIIYITLGSILYPRIWLFYGMAIFLTITGNIIILRNNPELLKQRSRIGKGTKTWDKWWLVFFIILFNYGMPLVAGLDIRSNGFIENTWLAVTGFIFFFFSACLGVWAMYVNKHFETTVRIQKERNHNVISDGPYRFVRHPGYLAIFFWGFGFPLAIGSQYALILGLLLIPFMMLRTYLEDCTLQKELAGYKQFTQKTRYRLFPGIW
jgi:protein-S-isoprenylcysteine O-methyltransferase Ste14